MDRLDKISLLPLEVLTLILKFVPDKHNLFTVSKGLYNAACFASKSDYRFILNGNTKIQNCFKNMIASKRQFSDFKIEALNMDTLTKDDQMKLSAILEKFGIGVHSLTINFDVIAEADVCAVMSYFPTIRSFTIQRNREIKGTMPKAIMVLKVETLVFPALDAINFDSDDLQFDKIFAVIRTDNIKKLCVKTCGLSRCFEWLKTNPSISELSLPTPQFFSSIPIDHLTLKNVSIEMPNAKSLISLIEQQTELEYFDLRNYWSFERDIDVSSVDSESSDSDSVPELDIDLLMAATKMKSLTNLTICIDEIPDQDFIHFSKLTQLKQLNIKSRKLDKIRKFSFVSLPNVTRLLLYFKKMHVPNSDLVRIAKSFPKVSDLIYELEYFCDAFICFAGNLDELERLTIIRNHDYVDDGDQFVASVGATIKMSSSLKALCLHFSFPDEQNVHKFIIRVALTAPNLESLSLEMDQLKIVPDNFVYILRNFKKLKNINLSYDLHPDENMLGWLITSMAQSEEYGKNLEMKIIEILKKYSTHLEYVQLCLSSLHDTRGSLWKKTFGQQFASIKADEMYITMKKDVNAKEMELFA